MNTEADMQKACASPDGSTEWHQTDWRKVQENVRRMQTRIVKATKAGRWGKVKALQRLLTSSYSAKALAVRRVTENKGKRTPGVDGEIWNTPEAKVEGMKNLKRHGYHPSPLRRVEIPKSNGKMRKLGIPTMKDRAMQALHLSALEPISETLADRNSYGFRKERSTDDAREQLFTVLSRNHSPEWVLEGDIKACFDNISHEWLKENVPMDGQILHKWLKAGYVSNHRLFSTESGTPQGGIISPTLANLTLDGMEKMLKAKFRDTTRTSAEGKRTPYKPKVNFVRYADDFVITGFSKELLENEVRPLIEEFLRKRDLSLSPEKTKVVHIEEGFDFLGWNFRKYGGKLLTKPSTTNVNKFLAKVRQTIEDNKSVTALDLIGLLNPMIMGWGNYHKGAVSKETFSKVRREIWAKLWQWAKRRHPQKSPNWVKSKYFKRHGNEDWIFFAKRIDLDGQTREIHLRQLGRIPIVRHIKIRGDANPFDAMDEKYFEYRLMTKVKGDHKVRRKVQKLWMCQDGICLHCGLPMRDIHDGMVHLHHILQRCHGGTDGLDNLVLLHAECHRQVHFQESASPARKS